MQDYKHIVVNIEQDDRLDEVIARLNNICNNEETLYCAEIRLNFFNKKKSELVDERLPYEKNGFDKKEYYNKLFGEQTDE
ncbi:MAG: hypothetical protein UE295_06575 [Acutalibacteraceae bacterium]|nr:hypothetical protein [Acutalibacteraceae bacterium]